MKRIARYSCFLLPLLATTGATSAVKGNDTISTSNVTVILTPSDDKHSNATITANKFGFLHTWPSNNGILSGGNATDFLTAENFSSCVQSCHRMDAQAGIYNGKTKCTCQIWSVAIGSTCLTSPPNDKEGWVFSMNPKPNNCSTDSNSSDNIKQDRLQLLPDFVLTFTFHLPPAFDPIINFTDSDEKLLTRRVRRHLADTLKEDKNDFASYVYMKPTNPVLFPSAKNVSVATITRKFSGFLKNVQSGTDINNFTSEAFQPSNIYGSRFLVNLVQDSFAVTKESNSSNDSASVLKYLYSFSFSIVAPDDSDESDNSVLVRAGNLRVSQQSSTTSIIITISLICGAFAFGLMIGGYLLLIRLHNRRDYGKLSILADPKLPHNRGLVVDNDDSAGLNNSERQHAISGCEPSSTAVLRYNKEEEDDHVFIKIVPSLKENKTAEYSQGSASSLEATERCIMIERSYGKTHASDEYTGIKDRHQNEAEDIRSEAVEVSECGIGDYYALLEDLDLHENLVLEDTECYQQSSFYKQDKNSFDNHTNDSSTAHPSVCSLEKIIVNAKVESYSKGSSSSSSSSGGASLKIPKTPCEIAHDVPIKMIELKPSLVSPASVICEIPDNDDLRSDEKESSANIFESVWNESDDETLQSYIPRMIQIPTVPSREEDQEVFSPPQIRRQEFALHAENVHQGTRESPDNEDGRQIEEMKLPYTVSNDHEGVFYTEDSEKGCYMKTDCEPSLAKGETALRESDSIILEIAEKFDSDGDSSAVMFSSTSYQASFIHGSACREAFPSLLPKIVRGYYDENSITSLSDGSQSDENCGLVSSMEEKKAVNVNDSCVVSI